MHISERIENAVIDVLEREGLIDSAQEETIEALREKLYVAIDEQLTLED